MIIFFLFEIALKALKIASDLKTGTNLSFFVMGNKLIYGKYHVIIGHVIRGINEKKILDINYIVGFGGLDPAPKSSGGR